MPLEQHEELKLAWEIAVMERQIDRGLPHIEKIRQDIDKSRADMALDLEHLKTQNRSTTATMIGPFAATLAAGAAIGHFVIK